MPHDLQAAHEAWESGYALVAYKVNSFLPTLDPDPGLRWDPGSIAPAPSLFAARAQILECIPARVLHTLPQVLDLGSHLVHALHAGYLLPWFLTGAIATDNELDCQIHRDGASYGGPPWWTRRTLEAGELHARAWRGWFDIVIRCFGAPPPHLSVETKPNWNKETGILSFEGMELKRITNIGTAKNVVKILDAFEEDGWPIRIDDPLPSSSTVSTKLHNAVKSLNVNLATIRFRTDGTGQGIVRELR